MHKRKLQKYNRVKTVKVETPTTITRSSVAANTNKRRPFNPNK